MGQCAHSDTAKPRNKYCRGWVGIFDAATPLHSKKPGSTTDKEDAVMRSCKKYAMLLGSLAIATLTACSSTFNAAPVPSSQWNQDYQNSLRLSPDAANRSRGW